MMVKFNMWNRKNFQQTTHIRFLFENIGLSEVFLLDFHFRDKVKKMCSQKGVCYELNRIPETEIRNMSLWYHISKQAHK